MDKNVNIDSETGTGRLLDRVQGPEDIREFTPAQLKQLADEVRAETVRTVAIAGGHLGASLGVVELTVALHHVFATPDDRLIWDVSHQCLPAQDPHRSAQPDADPASGGRQFRASPSGPRAPTTRFGAGHSSTSISAGLGMAVARDLLGRKNHVVAVIGDGSMSAGMALRSDEQCRLDGLATDRRPQ